MQPFTKIILFILMLLVCSIVKASFLVLLALLLSAVVLSKHRNFLMVLLRMRWLFLSILLVYAFSTPGELVPIFPLSFAPTYDGLLQGAAQLARLLIALAMLNLLLHDSTKQDLIAGLYLCLLPFQYLGLNVSRFAARLMLTLHYVETIAEQKNQKLSFAALHQALDQHPDAEISSLSLNCQRLSHLDKIILLIALLLTLWLLLGV